MPRLVPPLRALALAPLSVSLLLLLLLSSPPASASPLPRALAKLLPRACASYCGADQQFCCRANEACTTLPGNVATCLAPAAYGLYTSTWTETRTYTSTFITYWAPPPEPTVGVDCQPQNPEWEACGSICCAGWQTCAFRGQCSAKPGYAEPSTVIITSDGRVTTRYSAPFRITGVTTITTQSVQSERPTGSPLTATVTTTTTSASNTRSSRDPSAATDGSTTDGSGRTNGSGLSPGAIAGIVIGTLLGLGLLLLLCFCCIARGLWSAIFGSSKSDDSRRQKRRNSQYPGPYDDGHDSRRSAYSRRQQRHSGWFGARPHRPGPDRREKKRSSDGNWWLGLAGAAAGLLTLLHLRSDRKRPKRKANSSRYSDSYYTYSDATSASSASSGRRTNYTRRTADTRPPRSHYSRASRRP